MAVGRGIGVKKRVAPTRASSLDGLPFHEPYMCVRPGVCQRDCDERTLPEFLGSNVLTNSSAYITALSYVAFGRVFILCSEQKIESDLPSFWHQQEIGHLGTGDLKDPNSTCGDFGLPNSGRIAVRQEYLNRLGARGQGRLAVPMYFLGSSRYANCSRCFLLPYRDATTISSSLISDIWFIFHGDFSGDSGGD